MIFPFVHYSDNLYFFPPAPESPRRTRARALSNAFSLCFPVLFCGEANLASTPSPTGTVSHQVPGSESAATTPGTRNADEYRYSVLQTRCARLEQDLRATQGVLAVCGRSSLVPLNERLSCSKSWRGRTLTCSVSYPGAPEPSSCRFLPVLSCCLLLQVLNWMRGLKLIT